MNSNGSPTYRVVKIDGLDVSARRGLPILQTYMAAKPKVIYDSTKDADDTPTVMSVFYVSEVSLFRG